MKVVFRGGEYFVQCRYDERDVPRLAGFRFDANRKTWLTERPEIANRLKKFADENARTQIQKSFISVRPFTDPIHLPTGLSLYPFQEDAVRFALSRNRAYIAADPGLGKTIIAATIANQLPESICVYICPPFLSINTREEFAKWCPGREAEIYSSKSRGLSMGLQILPDSLISGPEVFRAIQVLKERAMRIGAPFILFVDEAHRFKNETAGRTKALFSFASFFDRAYYLSGTPMPNRPMELYTILSNAAPETIDFMSRFDYGRKYCAGHHDGFGWNFSGASNTPELADRITKDFMLRLKKDLIDLPPKLEEMVIIGEDLPARVAALDSRILDSVSGEEDLMRFALEGATAHVATYRRELGIAKVKPSLPFLRSILEETDESVLVFAYHKDVIQELVIALEEFSPLVITGETPLAVRDRNVKMFQTDPSRRIVIANYLAAGIGLTLTKATRVVFVEFSWVPADNSQASDRAHRIGQKESVSVQYLLYKNSIDRVVMDINFRKKEITKHL